MSPVGASPSASPSAGTAPSAASSAVAAAVYNLKNTFYSTNVLFGVLTEIHI